MKRFARFARGAGPEAENALHLRRIVRQYFPCLSVDQRRATSRALIVKSLPAQICLLGMSLLEVGSDTKSAALHKPLQNVVNNPF